MIRKHVARFLALAALITLALGGGMQIGTQAAPARGGQLVFGLRTDIESLDPHLAGDQPSHMVFMNIYDTLVIRSDSQTFQPGLAESWTVSADGKTYTFRLRKGVKFHDNTAFNAAAVKFNFDRVVNPETRARFARGALGPYEGTEVVDEHTVRVRLKEPYAPLLDGLSLAYLGMISPTAARAAGANFAQRPVGTGPFKFVERAAGSRILLEANADYNWAPRVFGHQGAPYLGRITFRVIEEEATRMASIETGETNVIVWLSADAIARFSRDSNYAVYGEAMTGTPYQANLNVGRAPLDDVRVRKALIHAVYQEALVRTLHPGQYKAAHSPLSPVMLGYDDSLETMYRYDTKKAAELLDAAGWRPNQTTGIRERGGQPLRLIAASPNAADLARQGEFVQAMFRAVGVDLDLRLMTGAARHSAGQRGEAHAVFRGFAGSDPDQLRLTYHSSNIATGVNYTFFRNARLDQILDEAVVSTNLRRRIELYREAQRIIMDSALIIPLYYNTSSFGTRAEVKGFMLDSTGVYPRLYDVYIQR
ncbi:MAG: ABC transporter substrate-binding protein [Armatimonadota bacterium]